MANPSCEGLKNINTSGGGSSGREIRTMVTHTARVTYMVTGKIHAHGVPLFYQDKKRDKLFLIQIGSGKNNAAGDNAYGRSR